MWFRKPKPPPFASWPIVRTAPIGQRYGRAFQVFINNWQAHLTTLDVYSDGLIDAWGALDRDLFDAKIRARWVVTRPNADQAITVHNFGMAQATDAKWLANEDDIRAAVKLTIAELNPTKTDLVGMEGSDTVIKGKVRHSKFSLPDKKPFHNTNGVDVLGDQVPVLVPKDGRFELSQVFVFADGKCRLGAAGDLQPIDGFLTGYDSGVLTNFAPKGSRIVLPGLGEFTTEVGFGGVENKERQKEIRDLHQTLNGGQTVIRQCIAAFREYDAAPSETAKETLRVAYEAVPAHLRMYCGDMDTKDHDIRRALSIKDDDEG